MKVVNKDGMTGYGGTWLNPDEMRIQWRPDKLEENVWVLIGMWGKTLREIGMKPKGEIYRLNRWWFAMRYGDIDG